MQAGRRFPERGHLYMGNNYGDLKIGEGEIIVQGSAMRDMGEISGDPWRDGTIPGGPTNEEYFEVLECIGAGYIKL